MKNTTLSLLFIGLAVSVTWSQPISGPKGVHSDVKFETFKMNQKKVSWIVAAGHGSDEKLYENPESDIPPYVAEVLLHAGYPCSGHGGGVLEKINRSPICQKLSPRQQQLLETGFAVWVDVQSANLPDNFKDIPDYFPTWLYAVSEADARLMTEAYLDGLTRFVKEHRDEIKQKIAKYRRELKQAQQELSVEVKERDTVQAELEQVEATRPHSDDPRQIAKQLPEFKLILDKLEIDLAGIRAKLMSIEHFRDPLEGKALSPQVQLRLDEMQMELMIELSGLEARKETAENMRDQDSYFIDLRDRRRFLVENVNRLNGAIDTFQHNIAMYVNELENPRPDMLPPKVYKNGVRVFRVAGSTAPEDVEEFIRKANEELPVGLARRSMIDRIRAAERYEKMVDASYLELKPSVAEALRDAKLKLQHKLDTINIKMLLADVGRKQTEFRSRRGLGAQRYMGEYLQKYVPQARMYLERVISGTLHLEEDMDRQLRELASGKWMNVLLLEYLSKLEMVDFQDSEADKGFYLRETRNILTMIDDSGLEIDPLLLQRLKDLEKTMVDLLVGESPK